MKSQLIKQRATRTKLNQPVKVYYQEKQVKYSPEELKKFEQKTTWIG